MGRFGRGLGSEAVLLVAGRSWRWRTGAVFVLIWRKKNQISNENIHIKRPRAAQDGQEAQEVQARMEDGGGR